MASAFDFIDQKVQNTTKGWESGEVATPTYYSGRQYVSHSGNTYDKEAFEKAAEKQQKWWKDTGSTHKKYGYDMSNPEDVKRASEGRYSVAYEKSFGGDEYSQWLLKSGQASGGYFEQDYNEAYNDIMFERQQRQAVVNFKKAVAREAWSTASDVDNITNDDIAAAAQRLQLTNPQYANIKISNPKTDYEQDFSDYTSPMLAEQEAAAKDAENRSTSLYLDDVRNYVDGMQRRLNRQEYIGDVEAKSKDDEYKSIIDQAIAASGFSVEIDSRVGLAKDSTLDEWNTNKELKRQAATAAVGAMEVAGASKADIKKAIRQDGRLSYIEDSEQGMQDEAARIQRRDASDTVVDELLAKEAPIVQASVAKAKALGNMGTSAQAGFSPISMMEGYSLSDEETAYVEKYMADTRLALEMSGYDGLEIDNAFRRADLGEHIDEKTARTNYAIYTLSEMGCSDEQIDAILGSWSEEDWADIDKDMAVSDYVEDSTADIAGKAIISVPIRAALSIVSGLVGAADMVDGVLTDRTEVWKATDWLNENAAYWAAYSHDRNHEMISEAADVGSEMLRMYATSMMGTGLAAASTKALSTAKGTNFLFNFISKNASRMPFVAGAIGNYYTEAMNEGTTARQAAAYAIPAGMLEGYLESLEMGQVMKNTFGVNFVGKKIAASGLSANFKQLAITKGMPFINFALDLIGEGLEEGISAAGSSMLRTATWDEYHQLEMSDVWENAKGGLILGAVMGGLSMGVNTQSYKYASKIYEDTKNYNAYIDSLQSSMYIENMDDGKRAALVQDYINGRITAERDAYIEAEAENKNIDAEMESKKRAVEAAEEDAIVKIQAATDKVAEIKQRIKATDNPDSIKKAKDIAELFRQLGSAKKNLAQVKSESDKKVKTATAEYRSVANKAKRTKAKNDKTIEAWHTANYSQDIVDAAVNAVSAPVAAEPPVAVEEVAPAIQYDAEQRIAADTLIDEVINGEDDIGSLVNDYGDTLTFEQIEESFKEGERQRDIKATKAEIRNILLSANYKFASNAPNRETMLELRKTIADEIASGADIGSIAANYSDTFGYNRIEALQKLYELRQKLAGLESGNTAPATTSVVESTTNSAGAATTADSRINTVKTDAMQAVQPTTAKPVEVSPVSEVGADEPVLKDLGANTPTPVEMAESKLYTNTYDQWLTEAEKKADDTGNAWYARSKERDTLADAKNIVSGSIRRNGNLDSVMAQLQDKNAWDATDVDTAMLIAETLRGEAATTGDYTKLNEWKNVIRQNMTQSGQAIQALAKWTRNSSIAAEAALDKAVDDINKRNKKKIESGKATAVEVSPELMAELQAAETDEQRQEIINKIAADIGSKTPVGLADKINAWRYLSMLGNPRTIIRNLVGNEIMSDVMWVGKDAIGTLLESGLDQSQRTKSLMFGDEYKANRDYATSTLKEAKNKLEGSSRYDTKKGIEKAIAESTPVFNLKPLEAARKGTNWALSKGDTVFLEKQYKRSFAQIMTARGYTPDTITAAQKKECMEYAIAEAQRSTFHDASKVADAISKLENSHAAAKILVGGVMPFKKTPINVLARGVEFSPIGLIQGTTQYFTKVKSGEMSAAQAVDKISAGLTGSALMALGVFLAKSGIITGGNEDEDKYYMSDLGQQEFALNIGDGKSVTIDWAAPATIPLFMGAALSSVLEGEGVDGENKFDAFINTLSGITDPLVEMSMLQGLQDTLESAAEASSNDESVLWSMAKNAGYNYVSSFVPTVGGQIARTIDPVRRDTTGDPTSEMGKELDKVTNKIEAKIPGVASNLEPYINVWGEKEINEHSWPVRLIENSVLPGYLDETDMTPVDVEITRLYSETQNPDVVPSNYPYRTLKDTKTKDSYVLSNKEFTAFKEENGKTMYAAALDAINDPMYSRMDDDERVAVIAKAIEEAQSDILSKYKKKYLNKD